MTVAYGQGGGGDSGGESDDPPSYYDKVVKGHAILASVSWVIFFPLGAVLMRLLSNPNTVRIHAAIQLFSTMVFTAAVGMGIWLARTTQQLGEYHPIIGLLIFRRHLASNHWGSGSAFRPLPEVQDSDGSFDCAYMVGPNSDHVGHDQRRARAEALGRRRKRRFHRIWYHQRGDLGGLCLCNYIITKSRDPREP